VHTVTVYLSGARTDEVLSFLNASCAGSRGAWVRPDHGYAAMYVDVVDQSRVEAELPRGKAARVEEALGGGLSTCLEIDVLPPVLYRGLVRDREKYEHLREFLAELLGRFRGAVLDGYGDHLWTLPEIEANAVADWRFFFQPGIDAPPPEADSRGAGASPAPVSAVLCPGGAGTVVGALLVFMGLLSVLAGAFLFAGFAGSYLTGRESSSWSRVPFSIVFGLMGLGTAGLGAMMILGGTRGERILSKFLHRPWPDHPEYGNVVTVRPGAPRVVLFWAIGLVISLFVGSFVYLILNHEDPPPWAQVVVGACALVVLGWVAISVYFTVQWLMGRAPRTTPLVEIDDLEGLARRISWTLGVAVTLPFGLCLAYQAMLDAGALSPGHWPLATGLSVVIWLVAVVGCWFLMKHRAGGGTA
jgi:hypothetical protein